MSALGVALSNQYLPILPKSNAFVKHAKGGMKIGEIAKATGMSSKKVRKYTQTSLKDYMPKNQRYLLRNAECIASAVHDLMGFGAEGLARTVPGGKATSLSES